MPMHVEWLADVEEAEALEEAVNEDGGRLDSVRVVVYVKDSVCVCVTTRVRNLAVDPVPRVRQSSGSIGCECRKCGNSSHCVARIG